MIGGANDAPDPEPAPEALEAGVVIDEPAPRVTPKSRTGKKR